MDSKIQVIHLYLEKNEKQINPSYVQVTRIDRVKRLFKINFEKDIEAL